MEQATTFQIAMIEPVGGHGGMDYYDFGLCGGLAQAGVGVILYTCDETKDPGNLSFPLRKWYRGIYGRPRRLLWLSGLCFVFGTIRVFWDVLCKRIPLVHFHFFDIGVLQAGLILLAKAMRRKVVVTVHDVEGLVEGKGYPRMATVAYRWADALVVHNQFSRAELIARLQVNAHKVSVIPHGNYCQSYPLAIDPIAAREQLGWSQSEKIVLFFGQLKGVKRLDLLLEALPDVLKIHPNVRLVIAGKEVDVPFPEYALQMERYGIKDQCSCVLHYISNAEVPLFYAACDLVALPYARIYQSGVLLMAMSFAKAVVVSDIPGMLEVVSDGETGYVFRNGNTQDLSDCILNALNDGNKRKKIAHQGYQLMQNHYGWASIGQLHAELYTKTLALPQSKLIHWISFSLRKKA